VYTATIISDDGVLITFLDKYNVERIFNHSKLITAEVLNNGY